MARSTEGSVERLTLDGRRVDGAGASTSSSPALVATAGVDVVRPGDTASVRDVVRDAIARTAPLRIVGRGTWLDAGRPVADGQRVALDGLTGIVDYTPGDLTLTARAGTTLAEIAEATAANGQWLALAPVRPVGMSTFRRALGNTTKSTPRCTRRNRA